MNNELEKELLEQAKHIRKIGEGFIKPTIKRIDRGYGMISFVIQWWERNSPDDYWRPVK